MARDKGEKGLKRFFIQAPPALHKRLRVLAAMNDSAAEKFGGVLLERVVSQLEAEQGIKPTLPPKKPK